MCNHFYSLVDNFLKARIRPDAVTSNDVLNLAFNPRKAICEGDFASKIIVSENFTQPNIEVSKLEKSCLEIYSTLQSFTEVLQRKQD